LKLGDLGIAKVLNSSTELARTVIGTPYYLSPEICEGKPYDDKSDVWALGCIMYELATLQRAFDGRTLPALVVKILSGKYPPVPTQYSPELRRMIASMLQLDPDQRPSMSTLLEESVIADAVAELGLEAYLFMDKDTSPIAFPDEDEDQDSEDRGRSPNQLGLTKWSSDINGDIDDIMNDLAGLASPSSNGPNRASPGRAPAATSSSTRAASSSSAAAHLTPKQSNRGKNGGRYHARQPSRSKRPLQSPVSAPGPAPVYDTIKSPLQQMITNQDAAQRKKQFLKDRREKREAKKKAEEDRIRAHKKKLQSIKSSVAVFIFFS
jgi:NIMA (never in mitosis gene a)-related kinase